MTDDQHVSVREFDTFKEAVVSSIDNGLGNVTDRLDTINGRIGKHDHEIHLLLQQCARQGVELTTIMREQQEARTIREHQRQTDDENHIHVHSRSDDPPVPVGDDKPITIADIKRIAWIAGFCVSGVGALAKYGPAVWKALEAYNGVK